VTEAHTVGVNKLPRITGSDVQLGVEPTV